MRGHQRLQGGRIVITSWERPCSAPRSSARPPPAAALGSVFLLPQFHGLKLEAPSRPDGCQVLCLPPATTPAPTRSWLLREGRKQHCLLLAVASERSEAVIVNNSLCVSPACRDDISSAPAAALPLP